MVAPRTISAASAIESPPRPRRWIPVSLRIFVVILALLSGATLWVAVRAYRQNAAILEIERAGGSVEIRPRAPKWLRDRVGDERVKPLDDVIEATLVGKHVTEDTLRHASRLKGLERLLLDVTSVTDAGLAQLQGLNTLRVLSLSHTNVTDAGLTHLRNLTNLKQLSLAGTQITDAGLSHINALTQLTSLSLERTRVTDAGLSQLRGLTGLQTLSLDNAQFTDTGRGFIDALTSVRVVWVDNRQVAQAGVANDGNPHADAEIADLVQRLDRDAGRRHFWSHHDETNAFEDTLRRIINIGGSEAERLVRLKVERETSELEAATKRLEAIRREEVALHSEEVKVDRLSNNLELLTALRRLQKQSDPLSISVALPRDLKADTRNLPTFSVSLKSDDFERTPVWVQLIPHFHGTLREAQWRFEVRDRTGNHLPIRPNKDMFRSDGGFKSDGWLHFGQSLTTTLPMGDFIDIRKPGEYAVTIMYHPKLPIADETDPRGLDHLITFRSVAFRLTVEQGPKRVIKSSGADKERALSLVEKLPDEGVVKIVGGTYDADDYEFVPPETPAGELLIMGWRAFDHGLASF